MPVIKSVSDLKNYDEVLKICTDGTPVFLMQNEAIKYVLVDIDEYEKQQATLRLFGKLSEAENSVKTDDWKTAQDLKEALKTKL